MSDETETLKDEGRAKQLEEKISAGEQIPSDEMVWLLTRINEVIQETMEEDAEASTPSVPDASPPELDDRALWETEQSVMEAFSSGNGKVYLSQSG